MNEGVLFSFVTINPVRQVLGLTMFRQPTWANGQVYSLRRQTVGNISIQPSLLVI